MKILAKDPRRSLVNSSSDIGDFTDGSFRTTLSQHSGIVFTHPSGYNKSVYRFICADVALRGWKIRRRATGVDEDGEWGLTSCWTFVATCWSRRWSFVGAEPSPRRGEEREGTKCLLRSHDEIPDTLQPLLTPEWCPPRHAIPAAAGDVEIVFEGAGGEPRRVHKRTYMCGWYSEYFYHDRGKNCLDTQEPAVPHEEEYWRAALVNNVAFNIVIYGIGRAICKTNGLTN